jgi:hypothetical protein
MLLTALRTMQDAAVDMIDMIEMNEKNEKEETDLRVVLNANKARGVSDAVVSPTRQRQQAKRSIVSGGKHTAPNSHMSPRTSMEGRRATSSVTLGTRNKRRCAFQRHSSSRGWRESDSRHDSLLEEIPEERNDAKDENDLGIFQNTNDAHEVSDAAMPPQQGQETTCNTAPEDKQAAPNSNMFPRRSPRRAIAGRRGSWAASSTSPAPGSKGRRVLPRQSSLRGCYESDAKQVSSLEEISEVKWNRLHDDDARSYFDATLSPQERHVRRRLVSPIKQAVPNSHVSQRRSIAGRRGSWAASSTTFGPGSIGRHVFPRQSSLRGCDSSEDGALVESSKAKRTRLHDYTESPINVL